HPWYPYLSTAHPRKGCEESSGFISLDDPRLRNRDNELAALGPVLLFFRQQLFTEIPWKQKEVIRYALRCFLLCDHRHVHPGRVHTALQRILFDGIVQNVWTDLAVVQQRVAFCRSSIGCDVFALRLQIPQS